MKVMVTGSTGFVGIPLCLELARRDATVHALARSVSIDHPLQQPRIRLFRGDILKPESIAAAIDGCDQVYHLAAFTEIWTPEPGLVYKINVEGTRNILDAAILAGVKRVVITSTAGVMGPSPERGAYVDESTNITPYWATEYEKTKRESEKLAFSYIEKGLDIVVVNPSRVYGPGLIKESNSVVRLVKLYSEGKWRFIPGDGESVGNYVFIDDVVNGHLLAMERGTPGERYILGGENLSYNEFFRHVRQATGKTQRMFHIPLGPMLFFARWQEWMARIFGKKPLIIPALVEKYTQDWYLSSDKARKDLGYSITSFADGLRNTLDWMRRPDGLSSHTRPSTRE